MKRIAILGSTGSIGESTLHVAAHLQDQLQVVALAAHSNIDKLEQQAHRFHPSLIAVYDKDRAMELQQRLPGMTVLGGDEGLNAVASYEQAEMVISAITGAAGLAPTVAAIKAGKDIGLANKESLVAGGALIMKLVKEYGVNLVPIDSEHSAIFQCLQGEKDSAVQRIILTSSGGPFREFSQKQLESVNVEDALKHPTWNMGAKVTIDSSTLMNKGLEMIEAYWLFGLLKEQITAVVHPQSIVHSMVEFVDHSILAQMGEPTMITPIQYAITYPERCRGSLKPFDFSKMVSMQFFPPDEEKFRCLKLAKEAINVGGSLSCYMNAANEVLVHRFLDRQIGWNEIATKLETLMSQHDLQEAGSLEVVKNIDALARREAWLI